MKKHHHIWKLVGTIFKDLKWEWAHADCGCGAIKKDCPTCAGTGEIIIEKEKKLTEEEIESMTPAAVKMGLMLYDSICRICKKKPSNNHTTKWLCTECSDEAVKRIMKKDKEDREKRKRSAE